MLYKSHEVVKQELCSPIIPQVASCMHVTLLQGASATVNDASHTPNIRTLHVQVELLISLSRFL